MILPYDVRTNIVWSDMQTATTLMDSVAGGRKLMQQIGSVSGLGKTTIAKKRFRQYGIVSEAEFYRSLPPLPEISATSFPGLPPAMLKSRPQTRQTAMRRAVMDMPPFENAKKRLFIEARPTKPISLVGTLHLCTMLRASGLLFDDPGGIAGDEAACDILKTSFGMQRTVTFETPEITRNENWRISGHGGYDPFVPPPDFPVPTDLRWLWLANTNYTDPAVLAKLGDHFAPLIARGLDPFWIRARDDFEHDHRDLFLYVHHLATEENLLRSMGFPYQASRKAVNFYVTHANRLVDLCPRRLELIAQAFAADQPPAALEAELNSMVPSVIIRPKLRLPASWVSVPDGALLWPQQPFSKTKRPVEGDPPRRIRKRERDWKRKHAPASEPDPPPAASQPVPTAEMPVPNQSDAEQSQTKTPPEEPPHDPGGPEPAAGDKQGAIEHVILGGEGAMQTNDAPKTNDGPNIDDPCKRKLGTVTGLSEHQQTAIADRWEIDKFRGGKIDKDRRAAARLNRIRCFHLLEQKDDGFCDEVGPKLLKLKLRVWLRDDIGDQSIEDLLS